MLLMRFPHKEFSWGALAFAFFIGAIMGGIGTAWLWPPLQQPTEKEKAAAIQMQAALEDRTEIVYVPKEAGERTDVQIDTAKPAVTVKVNGKETEFATLTEEKQKFAKGKLVITEEAQLKLEIKTPPQPRYSLGVGWGTNGPALMAGGRLRSGPANWWLYGDRKSAAVGLTVPLGQ